MNSSPIELFAAWTETGLRLSAARSKTAILPESGTRAGSQFASVPQVPPFGFFQWYSALGTVTDRETLKVASRGPPGCVVLGKMLVCAAAQALIVIVYDPGSSVTLRGRRSVVVPPTFKVYIPRSEAGRPPTNWTKH